MRRLKLNFGLIITLSLIISSCSTGREMVMPFKNYSYSTSRLFPINKNDTEFSFRVWINNSTSIERIISVSKDSMWGNQGSLLEMGSVSKKGIFKLKYKDYYSVKDIMPKSGYEGFVQKVDSLKLMDYADQKEELSIALHQPISLYVVEVKKGNTYNIYLGLILIFPIQRGQVPNMIQFRTLSLMNLISNLK